VHHARQSLAQRDAGIALHFRPSLRNTGIGKLPFSPCGVTRERHCGTATTERFLLNASGSGYFFFYTVGNDAETFENKAFIRLLTFIDWLTRAISLAAWHNGQKRDTD
jgi:hypothetical protein